MPNRALTKGFVAAQIGETLANYGLADRPLKDHAHLARRTSRSKVRFDRFFDDQSFWRQRFQVHTNQLKPRNAPKFKISYAAVTEWVARVPGLFWRPGSAEMRKLRPAEIESETKRWTTYRPPGKSRQVSGGIGTLRFPPTEDGFRLVTLTTSYNASAGVPALISPEVWKHHELSEGAIIVNGSAHWREMPQKWAMQFPAVRGIPRGCLLLDDVDHIFVREERAPILIHPFSVMEYWDGNAQLHDFVYATADSSDPRFRQELSAFFEEYRKAKDREGSYLVAADISEPMWDSTFASPEEMRVRKAAQLHLLEARVRDAANGTDVADALIRELSRVDSATDLKRLSKDAKIEPRRWSMGGLITEEAARLVDEAIRSGKQQALLQTVLLEFAP